MSKENKKNLMSKVKDRFRKFLDFGTYDPAVNPFTTGGVLSGINVPPPPTPDSPFKKATIRFAYAAYPYGAWRDIDITEIRMLSHSMWVKRCKTLIINSVKSHDWEIVSNDDNEYPELQKDIEDFLKYNTGTDEASGFMGLIEQWLDDLLDISTATIVKSFAEKHYFEADVLTYYGIPKQHTMDYAFRQTVLNPETPRGKKGGNYALKAIKAYDTYTFLKQLDIFGTRIGYWQHGYSLIPPRFFARREILYMTQNPLTYHPYGFGQTQSVLEIVKLLINATRNSLGFYEKGAIPQGILSLGNISPEEYEAFVTEWQNQISGNHYKLPVVKVDEGQINWQPFNINQSDISFLDGFEFYGRAVMSVFQIPPSELGYTDKSNRATSDNQSTGFKRKTIVPVMKALAYALNREIVGEFDPERKVSFKWIYEPDIEEMIKETAMWKTRIEIGMNVPDEYRKSKGLDDVWWGKVPSVLLEAGILSEEDFKKKREQEEEMVANMQQNPTDEPADNPPKKEPKEDKEEEKTTKQLITTKEEEEDNYKGRAEEVRVKIDLNYINALELILKNYLSEISKTIDKLPANLFETYDSLNAAELIANMFDDKRLADDLLPVIAKAYQFGIITIDEETAVDKGLFDNIKFITNYSKITASKFVSNFKEKIKFFVHDQAVKQEKFSAIVKGVKEIISLSGSRIIPLTAVTISQTVVNFGRINQIKTKGFKAWRYYAMEDERVCEICNPHHMKVYSVDDLTYKPPLHVQCRCLATPTGLQPLDFFAQQQDLLQSLTSQSTLELGIRPDIENLTKSMINLELRENNSLNNILYKQLIKRKSTREIGDLFGLSHATIQSFIKECKLDHLL